MKDFTISDLATILQLDASVQEHLEKDFASFNEATKDEVLRCLWDGVHELKDRLAKLKYDQYLAEAEEGKRELTTDLYSLAVKDTWKDLEDILNGKIEDTSQLEKIREELSQVTLPTTPSPTPPPQQ